MADEKESKSGGDFPKSGKDDGEPRQNPDF